MSEETESKSLLSKTQMGGIIGGNGYSFQDGYITSKVPLWLNMPGFRCILPEGTGDVDVQFDATNGLRNEHYQVKNHNITPSEFKEIIQGFEAVTKNFPQSQYSFVLAAPSLSAGVARLENALSRLNGAAPYYKELDDDLEITKDAVKLILIDLELENLADFVIESVTFETKLPDFNKNEFAEGIFIGNLAKLNSFGKKPALKLKRAYPEIYYLINNSLGKTLQKEDLLEKIESSIEGIIEDSDRIIIGINNWTKEVHPIVNDYLLEWSKDFDRETKKVPNPDRWDEYKKELVKIKEEILTSRSSKKIFVQGRITLSTALLFGAVFSLNGGWEISFHQPQISEDWNSACPIDKDFELDHSTMGITKDSSSLAVVFDITGRGINDVKEFIQSEGLLINEILRIAPAKGTGSTSIKSNSEAISYASLAVDLMRERIKELSIKNTELFYYGPASLALFIGQKLTSLGYVSSYEYQDPSYVRSFKIKS